MLLMIFFAIMSGSADACWECSDLPADSPSTPPPTSDVRPHHTAHGGSGDPLFHEILARRGRGRRLPALRHHHVGCVATARARRPPPGARGGEDRLNCRQLTDSTHPEYSNKANRGAFVAAVFSMQGIGILAAAAVSLIVTVIFKAANPGGPYDKSSVEGIRRSVSDIADYVWRIQLGAFPAGSSRRALAAHSQQPLAPSPPCSPSTPAP